VGALEFLGEGLQLRVGEDRRVGTVGGAHLLGDGRGEVIGQLVGHISDLVQLASLDHRVVEDPQHRGPQGLAAVDADEDRGAGVQAAIAQPGQQIGDHRGVLRRTLSQPERVLGAVDADPQRHHAQVLAEVHAVDHQRDKIQLTQRRGEQLGKRRLGRGDEAARHPGWPCRDVGVVTYDAEGKGGYRRRQRPAGGDLEPRAAQVALGGGVLPVAGGARDLDVGALVEDWAHLAAAPGWAHQPVRHVHAQCRVRPDLGRGCDLGAVSIGDSVASHRRLPFRAKVGAPIEERRRAR